MRTSFDRQYIQRWAFAGLTPWQRSMVRQQHARLCQSSGASNSPAANSLTANTSPDTIIDPLRSPTKRTVIEWLVLDDKLDSKPPGATEPNSDWGAIDVLMVSRRLIAEAKSDNRIAIFCESNRSSVRLLWDWSPTGKICYTWAKEKNLDGVIRDHASLVSWIQRANLFANRRIGETHPFLANIELPFQLDDRPRSFADSPTSSNNTLSSSPSDSKSGPQ